MSNYIKISAVLVLIGLIFMMLDFLFHKKYLNHLIRTVTKIEDFKEAHLLFKKIGLGSTRLDNFIGVLPFLWTWLFIVAAMLIALEIKNVFIYTLSAFYIATRMRALQEVGHFAMHGSLVKSKKLGFLLTNVFCQYPLGLIGAQSRHNKHCIMHHPNANVVGKDPNIDEFISIGFTPKISKTKFVYYVFYPIEPIGLRKKLGSLCYNFKDNPILRLFIWGLLFYPFIYFGLYFQLLVIFIIPLVIIYPLLAWISQIVEHRWFVRVDAGLGKHKKELVIGRPTEYTGLSGFFIKQCLFPFGDSYHLAHSLFQSVRYNYLGAMNKVLLRNTDYRMNISHGLILKDKGAKHSAISELNIRVTTA